MIIKSSKITLKYFQRKVKVAIKHTKQSKQNDILDWNAMFVYEMFNLAAEASFPCELCFRAMVYGKEY